MLTIARPEAAASASTCPNLFLVEFVDIEQPAGSGYMGAVIVPAATIEEATDNAAPFAPQGNIEWTYSGPIPAALVKASYVGRLLTWLERLAAGA